MRRDVTTAAAILGGFIILAVGMWIYFSPYHSCTRAFANSGTNDIDVAIECAKVTGNR